MMFGVGENSNHEFALWDSNLSREMSSFHTNLITLYYSDDWGIK